MTTLQRLHSALSAVAPIVGVSLLDEATKDVQVDYTPSATPAQRAEAQNVLAAFDWSDAAQAAWETATKDSAEPDMAALRNQATQAIADINSFLAIASPSNAQVLAEVRAIDQRQRAIIKALARLVAKTL